MSRFQLYRLRKKYDEFKSVINHPDQFKIEKVDRKTARVMKASGIKVSLDSRAIIPLKGFSSVEVLGEQLKFKGINKKSGKHVTETVTLANAGNFHAKLKHLSNQKLKRNQFLTVKIGDRKAFADRWTSYADLYNYVQNIFQPKDKGETKANLMRYMSVVEIEEKPKGKTQNATKGTPTKTGRKNRKG